jgi:hypothetical protein
MFDTEADSCEDLLFRLFNIPDGAVVRFAAVISLAFRKNGTLRTGTGNLRNSHASQ